MKKGILLSIQVGLPKKIEAKDNVNPEDGSWTSSFLKEPVEGSVWLCKTDLAGNGQADLKNHGGIDKAVNLYPVEHYAYWREECGSVNFSNGAMGENFTTEGLTEETVCIGDIYAVGGARIQISQPRQPCWKISRRWGIKNLANLVQETGRTGWYFRVLEEGNVEGGAPLELLERPCPEWTVEKANHIMHGRLLDRVAIMQLSQCQQLSQSWQKTLSLRLKKPDEGSVKERLEGGAKN